MIWLMVLCFWPGDAKAPKFEPLDPVVWNYGVDPQKGIYDGLLVQETTVLNPDFIEISQTYRILGENAQSSLGHFFLSNRVERLAGQVISRDGSVLEFGMDDLIETLGYKSKEWSKYHKSVMPPGLSKDCVLRIKYAVPAFNGYAFGLDKVRYDIAEPFYVLEKKYVIKAGVLNPSETYGTQTLTYSKGTAPIEFTEEERDGDRIFTFRNVPPAMPYPYGNLRFDPLSPYLAMGLLPTWARKTSPESFWQTLAERELKGFYEEPLKAKAYTELLANVRQILPKDSKQAFYALAEQMRSHFRDMTYPDPAHAAEIEKLEFHTKDWEGKLKLGIRHRFLDYPMFNYLFYQLAKDCGLPFELIVPRALEKGPFSAQVRNISDFEWPWTIFAYTDGEEKLMILPAMRHLPLGNLPAQFDGGIGMCIPAKLPATVSFIKLPLSNPEDHQKNRSIHMKLGENLEVTADLKVEMNGEFDRSIRALLLDKTEEELDEASKAAFEDHETWKCTAWHYENPRDLNDNLKLSASFSSKLETFSSGVLAVDPFPFSQGLIEKFAYWPGDRKQPLFLGYAQTQTDRSVLELPEGLVLEGEYDWQQEGPVGSVQVRVRQEGNKVISERRLVLAKPILTAQQEVLAKQFLAWLDASSRQRLALVKKEKK